jgi:2-octaprenylphenol hydroxylase
MAESASAVDVAIVGGGIAGLAAAVALARQGVAPLLLEARPLPAWPPAAGEGVNGFDARVSALTPRAVNFLERLEVWPLIAGQRCCAYRHMHVWDAEGTAAIDFDVAEMAVPALGTIVENRLLTGALAEQLRSAGAVSVLAPARLSGIERRERGVRLQLDDGSAHDCALLIAADGAQSPVRGMLDFRTREWDYGHRAVVTTVAFERGHALTAWQRFLPSGPLALLPLPGEDERLCSIVWSIDEERADDLLALDDPAFCAAIGEASEWRLGAALECAPRRAFPLRQRHALDYVQPGVALVADAAHTIHPLAGQGINLGLADVEVLVEEVLRARHLGLDAGRLDVLRRYQRRRKADNIAMMAAMDGFKRLFAGRTPAVRWLRNTGMRAVGGMPALKRRIMRHAMGLPAAH